MMCAHTVEINKTVLADLNKDTERCLRLLKELKHDTSERYKVICLELMELLLRLHKNTLDGLNNTETSDSQIQQETG